MGQVNEKEDGNKLIDKEGYEKREGDPKRKNRGRLGRKK